jgi:predicted flap endonuclease-1-like 5' DNA nuclease
MADVAADNWVIVLILLVVVVLAAWWLLSATRKTRIERAETSSDETPARRNQALIDAPRGSLDVDVPPTTPEGIAGAGAAVAAAAEPVHEHPAISADDLKQIKGIGPKLEKLLNSLGVTSYAQIAAWNGADIDSIDAQLGTFQGRIRRDDWPAQARLLAAGDKAAFEDRFGRL